MSKRPSQIDSNIIAALEQLKWPLPSFRNTKVLIRKKSRGESGISHVASSRHFLKVSDILLVPSILKEPIAFHVDPKNKKHFNYYGKRKGAKRGMYIKVVTILSKRKKDEEFIVTIYPTKKFK